MIAPLEIFTDQRDGRWVAWFVGDLETFAVGRSRDHAVRRLVARFPVCSPRYDQFLASGAARG